MHGRILGPLTGVIAVAAVTFFTNLGGGPLFDRDEALNATCGREMLERGDAIVPTFNGELRTAKPVLLYWLMMASYRTFGVNEFGARFASALLSVGTVCLVFACGRMLFNVRTGALAAIALASGLLFVAVGRASTPDPVLVFCVTLAMTAFVLGLTRRYGGRFDFTLNDDERTSPSAYVPRSPWAFLGCYAAMGLAVLAKGPVGLVLPVGILGLFLLGCTFRSIVDANAPWWRRSATNVAGFLSPVRIGRSAWVLRPLTALACVAVIALPWYVMVGLRTDGEWIRTFLGTDNVGRFTRPLEGHGGPFFYYVPAILIGFFPWSVFLPAAIWHTIRSLRSGVADARSHLFVACWAGGFIGIFSMAGTKLPNYVLPAYPALALMVAARLDSWLAQPAIASTGAFRRAITALGIGGATLTIAAPIAARLLLPGLEGLALVGVPSLLAAAVAFWFWRRERLPQAVTAIGVGSVATVVAMTGFAAPAVGVHQDGYTLGNAAREAAGPEVRVATYGYFSPNLVYYTGSPVERLADPHAITAYLEAAPNRAVIVPEDQFAELQSTLPRAVRVANRQAEFLKERRIVVLTNRMQVAERDSSVR